MVLLALACASPPPAASDSAARAPSFLVVLTDDEALALAPGRPQVQARLFDAATVFPQAVVNTPLCAPTRASLLSGGFPAHATGVRVNEAPQGGVEAFDDTATLATALHGAGWRTGFVGKYLGPFEVAGGAPPPGWDRLVTTTVAQDWSQVAVARSEAGAPLVLSTEDRYVTELVTDEALAFLEEAGEDPFFLVVAHFAPHQGAVPAAQDQGALAGQAWRPPSFNEADVSDKPAHIQARPLLDEDLADATWATQAESLLAVDRGVIALLDALEAAGRDGDTVVAYLSDNGLSFGEHRLDLKGHPYEEALRVPLALRLPEGGPGRVDDLVSASLDLPATILDLAQVEAPTAGTSLAPLLRGEAAGAPAWQLLEGIRVAACPDFAGVRSPTHSYVEYVTGEVELYDLAQDPDQLVNRAGDPALAGPQAELAAWLAARAPLLVTSRELVAGEGTVDQVLEARGGTKPYTWTAEDLPPGLVLDPDGRLHGVVATGTHLLAVTATDASSSPYDGRPQAQSVGISLRVEANPG